MDDLTLEALRAQLTVLDQLTGRALLLNKMTRLQEETATQLERFASIMPGPIADILRQAAADVRQSAEGTASAATACGEAIQSAINRLADNQNLTDEEKQAIMTDLEAAKAANQQATDASSAGAAAAGTIDPDVPATGVVDDPNGDVTPA